MGSTSDLAALWDESKPAAPGQQNGDLAAAWESAAPVAPLPTEEEKDARVGALFDASMTKQPDAHAQVLELARQTGLHPDLVESQLPLVKQQWEAAQFDPARFRRESPGLADLLLENPQLGPVAMRDQALTTWGRLVRRYEATDAGLDASRLGFDLLNARRRGEDTYALEKQIVALELQAEKRPGDASTWWEGALGKAADLLPSQVATVGGGAKAAAVGAVAGAALGATALGAGAAPGALAGASIGFKTGSFTSSLQMESGGAYLDIRRMRTDDGQPVDDEIARGAALAYGVAAAGVETMAMGPLLRMFGPLGDAISKGTGKAFLRGMLADRSFRALAKDIAKRWGEGALSEGAEEGVQNILQDMAGWWARSRQAGTAQHADPGASLAEAGKVALDTAIGTAVLGVPANVVSAGQQAIGLRLRLERSARAGEQVAAIAGLAKDSATARAAPEHIAQLVADETAKSGEQVTHLYVDSGAFVRLFQENGADPKDAARELLGEHGPEQLQEAIATGTKLEVPVAQYLEAWGKTDAAQALAPHTTTRPGNLTAAELATRGGEIAAKAKELVAQAEKEATSQEPDAGELMVRRAEEQLAAVSPQREQGAHAVGTLLRGLVRATKAAWGDERANELFASLGVEYKPGDGQPMAARAAAQGALQQADGEGTVPRGYMEPRLVQIGDRLKRVHEVFLNPNADASTAIHETGHAFLYTLAQLSEEADAPDRVKADLAATLKFLGVGSWAEVQTEHHEKFARAFEAYLYEGKAPSPALAGVFARFRLWLKEVYASVQSLNVDLSEDIRGVFGRLLATDQEIETVKRSMGAETLSAEDAAKIGLVGAAYHEYLLDQERTTSNAAKVAGVRIMKDRLRAAEGWYREKLVALREAATAEFNALPSTRAWRYLRTGEVVSADGNSVWVPDADGVPKLDRDAVKRLVGEAGARRFTGKATKKGGLNPDDVGERFGFETGEAMLRAMMALPETEREGWAKARAEERIKALHPDILDEREKLSELVAAALHGQARTDALTKELFAIRKKLGVRGGEVESFKRAAASIVEKRDVGLLNSYQALQDERSAGEKAMFAIADGNMDQAEVFKRQQLLAHFVYGELVRAREDRESFLANVQRFRRPGGIGRLGKAGHPYPDAVLGTLEALKLHQPENGQVQEHVIAAVGKVVQAMEANGDSVVFDAPQLVQILGDLEARRRESWRDLSVAEMRNVNAALTAIGKSATNRTTAILGEKRVEKEEVVADLVGEALGNMRRRTRIASSEGARTPAQWFGSLVSAADGYLLKIETMADWLAGGELNAAWYQAVILPLQKAKAYEADLLKTTIKPIIDAFGDMPAEVRARHMEKIDGAELFPTHRDRPPPPSRRFELYMLALNRGNASNLFRLTEGREITVEQVDHAIGLLSREEFAWIAKVQDQVESLWPLSRDLEERDAGAAPPKIEATPYTVALRDAQGNLTGEEVEMRGGYFPAVYDRRVSSTGERQAVQAVADLMDQSYTRPGTPHSHLKNRADEFADVIALDPTIIQAHLAKVAHDISHREALKSVGGLILDARVQEALKESLGEERAGQFLQWLKDIGTSRAAIADSHSGLLGRTARALKSNMVIGTLGHAVDVVMGDFLNPLVSVLGKDLQAKHLAAATLEFARDPAGALAFAREKSGELRSRDDHMTRALRSELKQLTQHEVPGRAALRGYTESAFAFAEWVDQRTAAAVWLGAYRQALADQQKAGAEVVEAEAVTFADKMVRDTFSGSSAVDRAAALRDKGPLGFLLAFQGYMNVVYNVERGIWHPLLAAHQEGGGLGVAKALPKALGKQIAFNLVVFGLAELLAGHGPDEGEDWGSWFARVATLGGLIPIPGLGAAVQGAHALVTHGKPNFSNRTAPAFASGEQAALALKRALSDTAAPEDAVLAALKALGLATGVPTRPLRAAQYVIDATQGQAHSDPADVISGLLYGERKSQQKNPITAVTR